VTIDPIATYDDYMNGMKLSVEKSLNKQVRPVPQRTFARNWRRQAAAAIREALDLESDFAIEFVAPPKNAKLDWKPDYALGMFTIAKQLSANPVELAEKVASVVSELDFVASAQAAGPYLNFSLSPTTVVSLVNEIITLGKEYGQTGENNGKLVVIDYSSPNIAKHFGINHLRSTVIGQAISGLLEETGYMVIRDNHLGDWGTQFGNLLAAHQEFGEGSDFKSLSIDKLNALYVRFNAEKTQSPELVELGQKLFNELESGNEELRNNWVAAVSSSLSTFNAMYERLAITFDTMLGESFFKGDAKPIIEALAEDEQTSMVVKASDSDAIYIDGEHPIILQTQDGYCIYAARDFATLAFRIKTYKPDTMIYVVGSEQSTYFRTIFDTSVTSNVPPFDKLTKKEDAEHIGFGLLLDSNGKKLSTRKGTSGKLDDLINEVKNRTLQETSKRNQTMNPAQLEDLAEKMAIGSIIWSDLKSDKNSNVKFDIDRMLELGNGGSIDVLYGYARSTSVLEKVNHTYNGSLYLSPEKMSDIEHELSVLLSGLGDAVSAAANARSPHMIIEYLIRLNNLHGKFYEQSRIIGEKNAELVNFRVGLHLAYKVVVEKCFFMLNIPIVSRI